MPCEMKRTSDSFEGMLPLHNVPIRAVDGQITQKVGINAVRLVAPAGVGLAVDDTTTPSSPAVHRLYVTPRRIPHQSLPR